MATYYVDSNATGLNSGSSWADAYTSILSIISLSGGDVVYVASNHIENNPSGSLIIDFNGGGSTAAHIISTNPATGAYQAGALFNNTTTSNISDITVTGSLAVFGCTFRRNRYLYLGQEVDGSEMTFENCTFDYNSFTAAGSRYIDIGSNLQRSQAITLKSCIVDNTYGNSTTKILVSPSVATVFDNLNYSSGAGTEFIVANGSSNQVSNIIVKNSDFSALSSLTPFVAIANAGRFTFENCNVPSGWLTASNYALGRPAAKIVFSRCSTNTAATTTIGLNRKDTAFGQTKTDLTVYRDGGASNSIDNYSFEMTTNTTPLTFSDYIVSPPISKYVSAGSQTITVYVAGSSSINNDDFYIEIDSPNESSTPTSEGKVRTSRPDVNVTPTALTSDTSTWTGSGVGTKQKVELGISPTIAGVVTVRCYLSKPSTTVYVDPKISTDGSQQFFGNVLIDGAASSGGGSSTPAAAVRHTRLK